MLSFVPSLRTTNATALPSKDPSVYYGGLKQVYACTLGTSQHAYFYLDTAGVF